MKVKAQRFVPVRQLLNVLMHAGIGVDDMFLLMSGWSETLSVSDLTVPERIGTMFKKVGIGITITSGRNRCIIYSILF